MRFANLNLRIWDREFEIQDSEFVNSAALWVAYHTWRGFSTHSLVPQVHFLRFRNGDKRFARKEEE